MTESPIPPSPFEQIRHTTQDGGEYWTARELGRLLGYTDYRNFRRVVDKARLACANSGHRPADHIVDVTTMIATGKGAQRPAHDVHLSRYGAYLTVQNADPEKEIVALGQTYFAAQTRRAEEGDRLAAMNEAQRRLYLRDQVSTHNRLLASTAMGAGVIHPIDFAIFQDHGYRGLYGGLSQRDIHTRKGLQPNETILDHMGSTELAANLFRATQTEEKIRREGIEGKEAANEAHYTVARKVRDTMADLGTPMPEDLPTPDESIQQLRQAEQKRIQRGPQLPLFGESDGPPEGTVSE